jgi:hypothetical protein
MNNTKNILLIAIISATLILGTSVIPMQSYAGGSDQHKQTKDFKSSIIANSESDKTKVNQHQDQENFAYRSNGADQANQGQQIAGNDNEAKGFNDQSDNIAASASGNGNGNGNGTGNGTGTGPVVTPQQQCLICLTGADLTAFLANPAVTALGIHTNAELCAALLNGSIVGGVLNALLGVLTDAQERCLATLGIDITL